MWRVMMVVVVMVMMVLLLLPWWTGRVRTQHHIAGHVLLLLLVLYGWGRGRQGSLIAAG